MKYLYSISAIFLFLLGSDDLIIDQKENNLEGYYIDSSAINNNIPEFLEDTTGVFTFLINRYYFNEKQRRILEIAESLFPSADAIFELGQLSESKLQINEPIWWKSQRGLVRIPYSITWSAVKYYWDQIKLYKQGSFKEAGTITLIKASFKYEAIVNYYESYQMNNTKYEKVYVVTQKLRANSMCGLNCGMGFGARRVVVIDGSDTEEVIAVFGDGHVITTVI